MKQLGIQLLLIVAVLGVAWRLLISFGQRAQALRRLGLLALAGFAVWSILDPDIWNRFAERLGIGRGADLILYSLVVAFFGFVVTTYKRFRMMETRYTQLARRIALSETPAPGQHPALVTPERATAASGHTDEAPPTADDTDSGQRDLR